MIEPRVEDNDIGGLFKPSAAMAEPDVTPLPQHGRSWVGIRQDLIARKAKDFDWRCGRIPIYVYHDNDELLTVSREAYNLFFSENALGRRAFPSLVQMEEEIIRMSLSLFRASSVADGSFTSGGTESIFLALKSARDHYKAAHPNGGRPVVIAPRTAHPAFDKAAHYLEIDVIRTNVGEDLRADVADMQSAIDLRTIMIVGSAPCYPFGVYDPIAQLGKLAIARKLWLHVDACLGGFLAPFARDEGYPIPEFDFSVPGVTSLSADLHKYGFSAKGASVLMYGHGELKRHQVFEFSNWPRGTYSTETFLGSRPGGSIASAWAVMQYLGRDGYRRLARKIMEAKEQLVSSIGEIEGLEVLRPSDLSIVLYRSVDRHVDIHAVAEVLSERGWFVGRSREPQALHLALNAVHAPIIGQYIADLKDAVRQVCVTRRVGERDDMTY